MKSSKLISFGVACCTAVHAVQLGSAQDDDSAWWLKPKETAEPVATVQPLNLETNSVSTPIAVAGSDAWWLNADPLGSSSSSSLVDESEAVAADIGSSLNLDSQKALTSLPTFSFDGADPFASSSSTQPALSDPFASSLGSMTTFSDPFAPAPTST